MGFVVFYKSILLKKIMNLKEEKCIKHFSETFFGYSIVFIK